MQGKQLRSIACFLSCFFLLLAGISAPLFAQQGDTLKPAGKQKDLARQATPPAKDTLKKEKYRSPRTATLLSAVVPGAGQIYNGKYWKLPIIYGALGGLGYLVYTRSDSLRKINRALDLRFDNDSTTFDNYSGLYSDQQLLTAWDEVQKQRDLYIILSAAIYVLNIVDANVDAHLFSFDVSEDLSFRWEPAYRRIPGTSAYGPQLKFSLRF